MVEVDIHLNNHIYLAVYDKKLKWLKQVTLGLRNFTTLAVLQYLFNTFIRVTLGHKEHNNESMRKPYEPSTPIDCKFDQVDERQNYSIADNEPCPDRQMMSLGSYLVL